MALEVIRRGLEQGFPRFDAIAARGSASHDADHHFLVHSDRFWDICFNQRDLWPVSGCRGCSDESD